MKIKFRTVLLVFLFIKLCILFTVLQETTESIRAGDHPLLFGTNDVYLFDVLLIISCAVSIATSLGLIVLFAIGHSQLRKPYTVLAFGINLVLVAPFFYSGLFLSVNHSNGLQIAPSLNRSFSGIQFLANQYLKFNLLNTTNGTQLRKKLKNFHGVEEKVIKHFEIVDHVQRRYCCCGLKGGDDYGLTNKSTALHQSIPLTSKLSIGCPRNSLFKNSTCGDSHLHGCEERLQQVHPRRILIYSCIGAIFSTLFLFVSPLVYSQFELDRRQARSALIREWRRNIEHRVLDHRMKHLRNVQLFSAVSGNPSTSSNAPRKTQKTQKPQSTQKMEDPHPERSTQKF